VSELSFGPTSDYPTWTPPRFTPTSIPTLPSLSLSDDEQRLIGYLQTRATNARADMVTTNSYYMGAQAIKNLEVAIPRELADKLRTLVGWASTAVDPYVDGLRVEGFRLPGSTQADDTLGNVWAMNGLDAEESLAYTDALAMRQAWWLVGSDPDGGDIPRVTVESPLNVAAQWDLSGRRLEALLQTYTQDGQDRATLMLPNRTIHIAQNERKEWELVDVDAHNFGYVTAVRMANRPRTDNRDGSAEITPALMSLIDSACRRLMGLEASSELYSVPRLLILGASAEDFTNPNGQARKAWDAYISKINVLERDDEGETPTVTQLAVYDPSVFTKVFEMVASQVTGMVFALPQELGLYTQGNPPSIESVEAMAVRRNQRITNTMQPTFGVAHVQVQQMALRYMNNGTLPAKYRRIEVDWAPPQLVNFSTTADAVLKLTSGDNPVLPARSDVVLKRLGLSAVERAQIEQDRGEQVDSAVVQALQQAAANTRQPAQQVNDGGDTGSAA
jgi:hypothetical protein